MSVRAIATGSGGPQLLATFADLVALPATNSGQTFVVAELNNAQFTADGTRWRPTGGQQLISLRGDIINPVVTLTPTDFATGTNNVVDTGVALPASLSNYYDSFGWSIIAEPTVLRTAVGSGGAAISMGVVMADTQAAVTGTALGVTAFGYGIGSIPAVVDQGAVWAQLNMFHLGTRKITFTPFGLDAAKPITRTSFNSYVKTTSQKFFLCCRQATGVVSGDAFALQRLRLYLRA